MIRLMQVVQRNDFNKPAKLIALDLIWASTGHRFNPYAIELTEARKLDQRPDDDTDEDTYVGAIIDPEYDTRFSDRSGFMYRRLPLQDIVGFNELRIIPPAETFSAHQIIEQINENLSTQLTAHDIKDTEYTSDAASITITASKDSWCWQGSITVQVGSSEDLRLLETLYLPGFDPDLFIPNVLKGSSRDRLVALINEANGTNYEYGVDFTLGDPIPYSGDAFYNTRFSVIPTHPSFVQQTIHIRRLGLNVLENVSTLLMKPVEVPHVPFSIHEILPQINAALNLDLSPSEVKNTQYETVQSHYRLEIVDNTSSLAWTASSYEFVADHGIEGQRYTEDGWPRLTEDSNMRFLEVV